MENQDKSIELKQIIEQSPVFVFLWKKQKGWPVEFVSENIKQLLGYSAEDFLNGLINYLDLVYQEDIPRVENEVTQLSNNGHKTFKHEPYRIVSKEGEIIWVDDRTSIRRDEHGEITHYQGVIIDISEKMETRRQLKKLSEVVEHTDNMIVITDIHSNIEYVNPKFTELMGYTLDEVIGKNTKILNSGIQPEEYFKELWETVKKGKVWKGEFINKTKHGKLINEKARISPVKDKNGNILNYISIKEDITAQKQAEKDLKENKEMQELILNGMDDALYLSSAEHDILYMNDAMIKKIGHNAVGKKCYRTIFNKDSICENCYFGTLKEKGTTVIETEKDGRKYKISSTLLKNNSKLTVYHDITDREENEELKRTQKELIKAEIALKKSFKELEIAKEKAEESDRLKTLFLANMSHEIRTPMNGILGFANLLSDSELNENQKNKYIEIIQNNSNHLLDIITDIMDISKIEAGQLKLKKMKTNINNMFSDLFSLYQLPAKKKDIQLMVHKSLTDTDCEIYTDYTKLRQILENLVSNALKFTDMGHIKIYCELKDGKLLFSIEDTGIGIRQEYQETIFDRFSQADNSSTRIYGGTGLGLSISQAYVHELGGDIWLKSETGKGTTFHFTIPYKPVKKLKLAYESEP